MSPRQAAPGGPALVRRQEAALAPVRAALLRDAAARADQILADARRDAADLVARARADAAGTVGRAREQGRAQAAPIALAELSQGRREAREILLGTELRARAELEARIRSAIVGIRDKPGYAGLLARLWSLARHAAGPGATVTEHHRGGALARAPGLLVDCSLPRLADRAIEVLGPRIRELTAL